MLGRQRRWEAALAVFATVEDPDPLLRTAALDACGKSLQLERARRLFDEMPVKTLSAYTALMMVLGRTRRLQEVQELFADLRQQCHTPDATAYTSVIDAHGMVNDAEGALRVFEEMVADGVHATQVTCGAIMAACGRAGDRTRTLELLQTMDRERLQVDVSHMNSAIMSCARSKNEDGARSSLQDLRRRHLQPDVVTYTILINCLQGRDAATKAEAVFTEMRAASIVPDVFAYNALLSAALRAQAFDRFQGILVEMDEKGLSRNRETAMQVRKLEEQLLLQERGACADAASADVVDGRVPQVPALPSGWRQATDPSSGLPYYWSEADPARRTQWERPVA